MRIYAYTPDEPDDDNCHLVCLETERGTLGTLTPEQARNLATELVECASWADELNGVDEVLS